MKRIRVLGDKLLKHIGDNQYIHFPYKEDVIQIQYFLEEYIRVMNSLDEDYLESISDVDRYYLKDVFEKVHDFLPTLLDIPSRIAFESKEYLLGYCTFNITTTYSNFSNTIYDKTQILEKCQHMVDSIKTFIFNHIYYEIVDISNNLERITTINNIYQQALHENYSKYMWMHKILEKGSKFRMEKSLKMKNDIN